jgi:translation initiation factor IF-3
MDGLHPVRPVFFVFKPFWRYAHISSSKELRINHQIRARQVRLVGDGGEQLGIVDIAKALTMAREQELDLVEVAPDGVPPVCRILNYGKFRYALRKKEKEASKKQRIIRVKELKIRPKIDEHDYQTKLRMAWNFFDHGDKVKVTLMFRGREMSHKELGRQLMDRIVEDMSEVSDLEAPPKDEGMQIIAVFNPKPLSQQKASTKENTTEKEQENV